MGLKLQLFWASANTAFRTISNCKPNNSSINIALNIPGKAFQALLRAFEMSLPCIHLGGLGFHPFGRPRPFAGSLPSMSSSSSRCRPCE